MKKIIIVGAGGAGVEALWVARRINAIANRLVWDVIGFADDNPSLSGQIIEGLPVLGTPARIIQEKDTKDFFHCAIGNNRQRQRQAEFWEAAGWQGATLVDPTVVVGNDTMLGAGSYVGPLSVIAPHARVGRHVLINSHVGVGHHAVVGDFAQLCPGVRVSGGCKIDTAAFLGSNAVVHPGLSVGEGASVGAGSFVIRSVKPRHSVLGVPARIVSRPAENGPNAQS